MKQERLSGRYHLATDLVINAPAGKVWDVLADFSTVETWVPQVTKSYISAGADRGVGMRRHCSLEKLGEISEVVTDWDEGHSLSYRVSSVGPMQAAQNTWTVIEIDDTTCKVRVELDYDIRFGAFGRLMHAAFIRRLMEMRFPNAAALLRERVETGKLVRPRRSPAGEPHLISSITAEQAKFAPK